MKRFLLFLTAVMFAIISMAQTKEVEYSSDGTTVTVCANTEFQFSLVLPQGSEEVLPDEIVYAGEDEDFNISLSDGEISGYVNSAGTYSCTFKLDSKDAGTISIKAVDNPDFIVSHDSLSCAINSVENLNCYMGVGCTISWTSDEYAVWDTERADEKNTTSPYVSFTKYGTHYVIATATDDNGCATSDTTVVTVYTKSLSKYSLSVNYEDITMSSGEEYTATIEFSSDYTKAFTDPSFYIQKKDDAEKTIISSDNIRTDGNSVYITFENMELGEYVYGMQDSPMEGTTDDIFSANLIVEVPCRLEYKSQIKAMVSEPVEFTIMGSRNNMNIEVTLSEGTLTQVTIPEEDLPESGTLVRYSVTFDKSGDVSGNVSAGCDWGSIVFNVYDKIKEVPVLTQKMVNICTGNVTETDSLDLNAYVQETTTEGISLDWIDVERSMISKNQAGQITYWARYVDNTDNSLMLPSDSVGLTLNFVSPYELYVTITAPEEKVYVSEGVEISIEKSDYIDGCITEWICQGADISTIDGGEESEKNKLLTFKKAGEYKLLVSTTLSGTSCSAKDSITIVVNEKTKLQAPEISDIRESYSSIDVAAMNSEDFAFSDMVGNLNEEELSEIKWFTKDKNEYTSIDALEKFPTEVGTYTYYVACVPTESGQATMVGSDTVSFSFTIYTYSVAEKTIACTGSTANVEISSTIALDIDAISVVDGQENIYSVVANESDNKKASVSVGAGEYTLLVNEVEFANFSVEEENVSISVTPWNEDVAADTIVVGLPSDASFIVRSETENLTHSITCDNLEFRKATSVDNNEFQTEYYTSAEAGKYSVTVVGTSEAGCSDTKTFVLVVNEQEKLANPTVAENIVICKSDLVGNEKSILDYIEYNTENYAYLELYDVAAEENIDDTVFTQETAAGVFEYTVQCLSPDEMILPSDVITFTVTIKDVTLPEVSPATAYLCSESDSVQFSAKSNETTIIWYTDESADLTDAANYTVGTSIYGKSDNEKYYVRAKDSDGCLSEANGVSLSVSDMYVEISVDTVVVTLPETLQATAYAPEGATFTWTCVDATITAVTETEPAEIASETKTLSFDKAGTYTLSVFAENKETGCTAKSEVEIVVNEQPKLPTPVLTEREITICKSEISNNGLSLSDYVTNEEEFDGSTKWYDVINKQDLESAPILFSDVVAGTYEYAIANVPSDEKVLGSDTVTFTVTIKEVTLPEVSPATAYLCSESDSVQFSAKSNETIIWYTDESADLTDAANYIVGTSIYGKSDNEKYYVRAKDSDGCLSEANGVSLSVSHLYVELGADSEEITLPEKAIMTASTQAGATLTWSCEGATFAEVQSNEQEVLSENEYVERKQVSFEQAKTYVITVSAENSETGCTAKSEVEIVVNEQPKLPTPVLTEREITICKNEITENGYSLYEYLLPDSIVNVQWTMVETKEVFTETPILQNTVSAGIYEYELQNVSTDSTTLSSDVATFKVTVVDVAAPIVAENVQICTTEDVIALSAESENTVLWSTVYTYIETGSLADTAVYKRGYAITSPYEVDGVVQTPWHVWATDGTCYSEPKVVTVEVSDMYVELSVDTVVTLPETLQATAYAPEGATFTWTCVDATITAVTETEPAEIASETKTLSFDKAGTYTLSVFAENKETGCTAKAEETITVSEKPQEYFLNCPDGEVTLSDESWGFYVTAGDTEGKIVSYVVNTENDVIEIDAADSSSVKYLQEGTATVVCTITDTADATFVEKLECELTIKNDLTLTTKELTVTVGEDAQPIIVSKASGDTFESSDLQYTISETTNNISVEEGYVKGLEVGEAEVIVSYRNQVLGSVKVLVELDYYVVNSEMELQVAETSAIKVIDGTKETVDPSSLQYKVIRGAEVVSVDENGTVTAIASGNAIVEVLFAETLVGRVSIAVETQPQMAMPGYNTNVITMCYEKSSQSEGVSLERMVYPTSEAGKLQWYDNAGNRLENAPIVSSAAVGKTTYYVSQVGTGDLASYLESEKVPFSVVVSYIPEPTLNMYDQKICDGSNAEAFVAKSQEGTTIAWLQDGQTVAEGNSFIPTATGSFYVYAYSEETGCASEMVTITNTVGSPVAPEITVANKTFALGETISISAAVADTNSYSIVWKQGEKVIQGQEAAYSFKVVGDYSILCQSIEKNTGCIAEKETTVTVEKKTVLVDSIVVEPANISVYSGDKTNYAVIVYPSFVTNKKYTVSVADVNVAVVRGSIIYGLKPGTTTMTVTSKDKNATITVPIEVKDSYVAVQEISLPNIITLGVGDNTVLEATVKPEDATNKKVEYSIVGDGIIALSEDNTLTAVGEGTATLVAKVDNVFSSTVVYVTSNQEVVTDIIVPEEVVLKEGASKTITCKVAPVTLAANDLTWEIADETIASLDKDVVVAKAIGTTELKISSGNITKVVSIVVNKSDAPQVNFPENFYMPNAQETGLKSLASGYTVIPVSDYISDDNTALGSMQITVTTDQEAVTACVDENGKILVNAGEFIGTVKITVTVTDVDGLTSTGSFFLVVENVKNQAPTIIADTIQIKYNEDVYVNFADIAKDDYTAVADLTFAFSTTSVEYEVIDQQLRLKSVDETLLTDILKVTVSDIYGDETEGEVVLVVNSLPNKAPVIAEIAAQEENDSVLFASLDLKQYVKDDYTSASAIVWSAESSANLAITITDGVAVPTVLNKFWNGVEPITFVAKDEEGLTSSVVVYYKRKVSQESYDNQVDKKDDIFASKWDGAPTVTITTMRQIGVPGDVFVLMANISSFDCTWEWNIEGAKGIDQTSMMQMITFDKPGVYPVALTVTSADEKYSITANLAINLTVVGIQDRDLFICQGQSAQLNATDGVTSYYWSTGEVAQTISIRPEKTSTYAVTMKKGMFTMKDSVTVHVSVPVALMEDSVMCVGTTFELEAQGDYSSYSWNNGESTKSIMIPAEVATYSVFAVDSMQCASVDTFNLTKVNELPKISLGDDQTPCDGTTVTLDAGEGYTYLWSNGATTQTIDLTDSTRTVWAQITDKNLCVNSDTITVAFSYPFPEQIGVATFSETTDHIIIAWEKTKDVNTVSYRVERETDVTDNWEQVGDDVMFDKSALVVDEDVNYKQRAYKYRLVTVDGCQNEAISEVHRSMISTITYQTNGLQTINWCAYEPMENVTQYLVLRGTDATAMDTVDKVPASNLYEIWNETDPKFKGDENIKYRVVFRLKSEINENAYKTLDGQTVVGAYTKAESGPFSLALSNIAEAENDVAVKDITFPADVIVYPSTINTVINVAIASHDANNYLVEVLNANGQVVAQTNAKDVENAIISIPAAHLSQGLYNVRISTNGEVKTIKVVK